MTSSGGEEERKQEVGQSPHKWPMLKLLAAGAPQSETQSGSQLPEIHPSADLCCGTAVFCFQLVMGRISKLFVCGLFLDFDGGENKHLK